MKKRFLSLIMVGAMTMALTVPAYAATAIGITDSVENVVTDTLNKTTGTDHFATNDNYDGPAGAPTNVWNDGSIVEEVKVTAVKTAEFTITVPKEIVMDGATATADYTVNVVGDIAGDQRITVQPDASFQLAEAGGKANVTATITQANTTFDYNEINVDVNSDGAITAGTDGKTVDGSIAAPDLTAGDWSGKFNFNITYGAK